MPKYSLYTVKKNGLQANTSKIEDIRFRGGTQTQQGFRKSVLNLTGVSPIQRCLP